MDRGEAAAEVLHRLDPADAAAVREQRRHSAALKGKIDGPHARPGFEQLIAATLAPPGVVFEQAAVGGVAGWWCRPGDTDARVRTMFVHGGGYVLGNAAAFRNFAGQFAARLRSDVFIPDYRLAPEHPFPAAFEDLLSCYGAMSRAAPDLLLIGDSAGGGLVLALLSAVAGAPQGPPAPAGAAVMSPWTDLALTGDSMVSRAEADPIFTRGSLQALASLYLAGADPADPRASPFGAVLERLPPMRIDVGEDEVLLDDSRRYAARANSAGSRVALHVWAGMSHVFVSGMGGLRAADIAVEQICEFLRGCIERPAPASQG